MITLPAAAADSRKLALILGATLFTFWGVLDTPFHYDDHAMLGDSAIVSPDGWRRVWRIEQTRPLTYFTFWANHAVAGPSPRAFHAVNLGLHAVAVTLLFACLPRLLTPSVALVAVWLFAIHPVQTEAVTYVFARGSLIAAVFCLTALWWWIGNQPWLAVPAFALALLGKEECAAFPVFLWLLDRARQRPEQRRAPLAAMLAFALIAVGRVAWAAATVPGSGAGAQAGHSVLTYLGAQSWAILRYCQLLAVPIGFSAESPVHPLTPEAGLLLWAVVATFAVFAARASGRIGAGFWFLAALILLTPTSSVFPAADLSADRRLYLPMIAFAAFGATLLRRTHLPLVLGLGGFLLAALSVSRVYAWRSEETLWEDALRWAPRTVRPRVQLARLAAPELALRYLEEAEKIAPDSPVIASEKGRVFLQAGQDSQALAEFGRALARAPNDASALNNRGVALSRLGLRDHAIADFRHAIEIEPCFFEARLNLRRTGELTALPPECRFSPAQVRQYHEVR